MPLTHPRRVPTALLTAVTVPVLLTACSSAESPPRPGADENSQAALPSEHVHAVAVNPADDQVYLATHDGLFAPESGPERIGPLVDLMGFTVAGPDHFYASGHPGPGTDLPQPVGLIESTDGGRTWTSVSRGGESDFHTLTASSSGVTGFDGSVRTTTDGVTWETSASPPAAPFDIAASPDGAALLATTQDGLVRSDDGGTTWSEVDAAPLLLLVEWADATTAVGATPDGEIVVSTDAAQTWGQVGEVGTSPQALGAQTTGADGLRVLVVAGSELLESRDGGATFDSSGSAGG